jgi:hypothetical protein
MRGQTGSFERKAKVLLEDKVRSSRKIKAVEAVFRGDDTILEDLFSISKEDFFVMEKSEGGKICPDRECHVSKN